MKNLVLFSLVTVLLVSGQIDFKERKRKWYAGAKSKCTPDRYESMNLCKSEQTTMENQV